MEAIRNLPFILLLSLAAFAGCSGGALIANGPDGGGSSGSSSGNAASGSPSSGTAGSGSVSSGSAGTGFASSGTAGSGSVSSGSSSSGSGSGSCMEDAGVCADAGPACFTDPVGADYKGCAVDTDCAIKTHQSDCCGTLHMIGVSKALSGAYDACESTWDHHFPGCGCAPMLTTTDDGSGVSSPSAVAVHCLPTSAGGNTCQTTVSAGVCTSSTDCGANNLCGFPENAACNAKGHCVHTSGVTCQSFVPGCACDGTAVNIACNGLPHGYQTKPLRHQGACVDGG